MWHPWIEYTNDSPGIIMKVWENREIELTQSKITNTLILAPTQNGAQKTLPY